MQMTRNVSDYCGRIVFSLSIILTSHGIPSALLLAQERSQKRFEYSAPSMGSNLDIVVYASSEEQATQAIMTSLKKLEDLSAPLNNYDPTSEVSKLASLPANKRVKLSQPLSNVLIESERWLELSNGRFDITNGRLIATWRSARKRKSLPTESETTEARSMSGWANVDLRVDGDNGPSIAFRQSGIVLDVAGIATGYLLDRMMEVLVANGIQSALIDAGGDVLVSDPPPGRTGWSIDVAGISKKAPPLLRLSLRNCAVTTSGDLYQFVEIEGRRYSHLMDPTRGTPVEGRQSVTVIAKNAIDADAGATALAILGADTSFHHWSSLPIDQAIFLTHPADSEFPIYRSLSR
ncbi:MAG: FAD:protein FMN transferase [Pirellula sp.]|nr:FAD:protein FMN transferase [Pirellula sp.]